MGEVAMDDYEVVIIGAGICGLATALALHKKGIKSVVMEKSEALRNITGAAIGIRPNGWRALDQLGVADVLRGTAISVQRGQTKCDLGCYDCRRGASIHCRDDLMQMIKQGIRGLVRCSVRLLIRVYSPRRFFVLFSLELQFSSNKKANAAANKALNLLFNPLHKAVNSSITTTVMTAQIVFCPTPLNNGSIRERIVGLDGGKLEENSMKGETRCLKRKDLIDTLYAALPPATVKFGRELESIKLDPNTTKPVLRFIDGSSIIPKVVIGCDGGKSVIADFLNLKPTKMFPLCAVRGLSNYPNGHTFDQEFARFRKDNNLVGRIPMGDKLVYWFCARPYIPRDEKIWEDPEAVRQSTLALLSDYPQEIKEMIEIADANSLSITHLRYRAPWDLLTGTFYKGRVTVAGDAMHVMGPFLGQGGSAGLEDAVVLARNLAQKGLDNVEEAFDIYVKERRMRVVRLSLQTYFTGMLLGASSSLKKLIFVMLLFLIFRNSSGHVDYDCGSL